MAISLATPRHVFGASVSCFAGALAYADNQAIIYPAGSCLIAYNIDQREQKIVMGSEHSRPVTALAITPNRRFIAVAEMGIIDSETDRASIIVYDVQLLRKRKILTSPDMRASEYRSIAFSPDSKYLATLGSAPDWTLTYWHWEKSKALAMSHTGHPVSTGPVEQVCFSVTENTHMSVVGDGVFKMYRYSDGSLRQFAMQKADFPHFVSHAWLTNDLVLAGTTNGRLIVIDSTEYKREYVVFPDNQPDMRSIPEESAVNKSAQGSTSAMSLSNASLTRRETAVTAILCYVKGFACACGLGTVHLFEKSDEDYFHPLRVVTVTLYPLDKGQIQNLGNPFPTLTSSATDWQ